MLHPCQTRLTIKVIFLTIEAFIKEHCKEKVVEVDILL